MQAHGKCTKQAPDETETLRNLRQDESLMDLISHLRVGESLRVNAETSHPSLLETHQSLCGYARYNLPPYQRGSLLFMQ